MRHMHASILAGQDVRTGMWTPLLSALLGVLPQNHGHDGGAGSGGCGKRVLQTRFFSSCVCVCLCVCVCVCLCGT